MGIRVALEEGAEHVLLLNNDATVEPGFLEPLVDAASGQRVGAACAQILHADPPHAIWYAGASYDPRRGHQGRHDGYGEPRLAATVPPFPTGRACGGAMLLPREAAERVGALDESLFAYAEDVEWSLRAHAAGLSIVVVPASVVYHRVSAASGGASSPDTLYYALRNGLVVAERAAPLGLVGRWRRRRGGGRRVLRSGSALREGAGRARGGRPGPPRRRRSTARAPAVISSSLQPCWTSSSARSRSGPAPRPGSTSCTPRRVPTSARSAFPRYATGPSRSVASRISRFSSRAASSTTASRR